MSSSMGRMTSHIIWKNKTCLKPPTRIRLKEGTASFYLSQWGRVRLPPKSTHWLTADTGPGHGQPGLWQRCWNSMLRHQAESCAKPPRYVPSSHDLMIWCGWISGATPYTEGLKIGYPGYPIHWLIILFRHHFGGRQRISRQSQWVFWNHLEPNNCVPWLLGTFASAWLHGHAASWGGDVPANCWKW